MIETGNNQNGLRTENRTSGEKRSSGFERRAVGRLLWDLRLDRKLPAQGDVDWSMLRQTFPLLSRVTEQILNESLSVLRSIVVLDETVDDRVNNILTDYHGKLIHVRQNLTNELYMQSPDEFHAHVADFNDNLSYCMQTTRGFPSNPNILAPGKWQEELHHLEDDLKHALHSDDLEVQSSFLKTDNTVAQPAHVDYSWEVLTERAHELWLAFFPLTSQGMILQLWRPNGSQGLLVFIPLGKMLLVPSDTIHGGGFRTFPKNAPEYRQAQQEDSYSSDSSNDDYENKHVYAGNMRYHLYIATHGTSLPKFAQNVYTIRGDKRRELSKICTNANGLDGQNALLMETLFE